jgi:ubiquinone/menaquinone biosynthesis C-methylase UbiE
MWSRILFWLLASGGCAAFLWLVVVRAAFQIAGERCPFALAWLVEHPIRRRYLRHVLDRVGILAGERVLELGPGPGAFTIEAAHRVGLAGTLVTVVVVPRMIAAVEIKVWAAGLSNVQMHVASADQLPLEDASIDRAFLITVLPEVTDRPRALAELRRVLKAGGVLSVTEEFLDPHYPRMQRTLLWAEAAGFRLVQRHGNWWVYTLNFST